ncbi:uncharacterized protein BXZ73DRAFT_56948 [Epithele typhae]|uniref:uncharacterized protein n=1 Tax=Epithele typhae TaxID=378194 RepID=UPI002008D6E6|nr:uncharacterized protein BXZ73DRAFT_56948 [Epithele typhae]KAH9911479.1 hypothetical protein BXZ73DRAFT_56948 [Epithele typhae]
MPSIDRPRLGDCGPFDGYVASDGFSSGTMFTTPNQAFVPQFALAFQEITTFDDGLWGVHELSRWPQQYHPAYAHLACIPREDSVYAPKHVILWMGWSKGDWTRIESTFGQVGQLDKYLLEQLLAAADSVVKSCEECENGPADVQAKYRFLRISLRLTMDRLRLLPAVRGVVFSLASHVQRLTLELAGLRVYLRTLLPRLTGGQDCRLDILDVLGAYTNDPSVAQRLHLAGVPVWLQQERSAVVAVYESVAVKRLPFWFSRKPSVPRLVLAQRDFAGTLNVPGEWVGMMVNTTNRQLLGGSRLDELPTQEGGGREAKRWRGSDASTPGARDPSAAQTLPHLLAASAPRKVAHNAPSRAPLGAHSVGSVEKVPPTRRFYMSLSVAHGSCWIEGLRSVGTLPQPPTSPKYYWPPPWIFDRLDMFSPSDPKRSRYLIQLLRVGEFCRRRLFDRTLNGAPLGIQAWRDLLWGEYGERDPVIPVRPIETKKKAKRAKERMDIASIFAGASLPRFQKGITAKLGDREVTEADTLQDDELLRTLVWEAHEINWRCEMLALDSVVVGSRNWPEVEQWTRESLISEVWGPPCSALNVFPSSESDKMAFLWLSPADPGWEVGRPHLRALLDVQQTWPRQPAELAGALKLLDDCDSFQYSRIQAAAAKFYVDTFVHTFQRLPVPPARHAAPLMFHSTDSP